MTEVDRKTARDYDDRTARAVKSVLVEIAQILGSFKGKYVVIGGAVPWLLPIDRLVDATRPMLGNKIAAEGYRLIAAKFRSADDFGPTCVKRFIADSQTPDGRTAAQWQMDAYGQVSAWLGKLGLM